MLSSQRDDSLAVVRTNEYDQILTKGREKIKGMFLRLSFLLSDFYSFSSPLLTVIPSSPSSSVLVLFAFHLLSSFFFLPLLRFPFSLSSEVGTHAKSENGRNRRAAQTRT